MRRDAHVRFRGGLGVRFPRATRLPQLFASVEEVHDLNRAGVEFRGDRPNPFRAVAHDDLPRGLALQAADECRRDGIGVAPGRAVDRGRVGHRARIPDRAAVLVTLLRGPQHDHLPLARARHAQRPVAGEAAPAAGAGCGRTRVIGEVGVEAPLDGAGRQLQRLASQVGLERFEVELVRRPGSYEPGDLGFDRGGEFLLAGFFLRRCSRRAAGTGTSRR